MDAILGVAGVSLFAKFDDPRRRQMYGLAGEYRLPPHGLEYRTLSNAWLFHPVIANIIFDLARSVFVFGDKGLMRYWKTSEEETIRVINTCDVKGARAILKNNELILKKIIKARAYNTNKIDYIYGAIMNGMESIVNDPTDIVGNWDLKGTWKTHCDGAKANVSKVFENMLQDKKV